MASSVAHAPEASRAGAVQTERRSARRHPCELEAYCSALGSGNDLSWRVTVVNLSVTGLCVRSTRRFEPTTFLSFEIEGATPESQQRFLATVVYAQSNPAGAGWIIGCEIIRRLSKQELRALLS